MKEAIRQKKVAYNKMCEKLSEENKVRYKNIKNRTEKAVANSMREEAEKELTNLGLKPNNIFKVLKFMKIMGKISMVEDASEVKAES